MSWVPAAITGILALVAALLAQAIAHRFARRRSLDEERDKAIEQLLTAALATHEDIARHSAQVVRGELGPVDAERLEEDVSLWLSALVARLVVFLRRFPDEVDAKVLMNDIVEIELSISTEGDSKALEEALDAASDELFDALHAHYLRDIAPNE